LRDYYVRCYSEEERRNQVSLNFYFSSFGVGKAYDPSPRQGSCYGGLNPCKIRKYVTVIPNDGT